jgi:hypothetical protein
VAELDPEFVKKIDFLMELRTVNPVVDYTLKRWDSQRKSGKFKNDSEAYAVLFLDLAVNLAKTTQNMAQWIEKLQAVRPYQIADPIGPYITVWQRGSK